MATHSYNIANQKAPAALDDINDALEAIVTNNSSATEPSSVFANMIWYDTTNNLLKIRNEGNTAWITLGTVDQINSTFEPNQTIATQAEAEAGVQATKLMTAQRVAQAIAALVVIPDPIGVGQTWQSVSRSASTNYQNTTGRPIMVAVSGTGNYNRAYVGTTTGTLVQIAFNNAGGSGVNEQFSVTFIVPTDHYYQFTGNFNTWAELR
jgi:hypothetical protein